jgi:putative chitinase
MAIYRKGSSGEDVVRIQKALKEKGFLKGDADGDFGDKTDAAVKAFQSKNGLEADGVVGPGTWKVLFASVTPVVVTPPGPFVITRDHLSAIAGMTTPLMPDLSEWINKTCPSYGIDTPREYAHFLAQACHETDHFKTLKEYASGKAYENRRDLGNTQPGDGVRFKGRGIFQTTGRANYQQLGIIKGKRDLFTRNPELLEQPEYAVWSACEYWKSRNLNDAANHPDSDFLKKKYKNNVISVSPVEFISITINGGFNGIDERKKFYERAKSVLV